MRSIRLWLPITTLALGLIIGVMLRPFSSTAEQGGTPQPSIASGFTSDQLIQIPAGFTDPGGVGSLIELRDPDGNISPAALTLARYTYEPGGQISLPYPFPGPVAFYVEQGTLTLDVTGPAVHLVETTRDASSARSITVRDAEPGTPYQISTGNYLYTLDGDLGPTRNEGTEPLTILAIFLQPQSGGDAGEG